MTLIKRYLPALLLPLLLGGAVTARPPVPETPAAVLDIVYARPFTLERAGTHHWRSEKPPVRGGYVLVLKVDPAFVTPHQTAEPVLYVGRQTAERINVGDQSGYVVAVVPGVVDDPTHPDYIDLAHSLIWFGTPALPERVDATRVAAEHKLAVKAGIHPFPAARIAAARERGGEPVRLASKTALVREAAFLVAQYSPQEKDLVRGILHDEAP